ncbi:MAG: DoxX family protein [Ignavibacteria bacterium]|nr:DoxX family protein [Ignavibacteria bacterium]
MNNSLSRFSDYGILLLRIGVGLIFIFIHGLGKITAGPDLWKRLGGSMSNFGITFLPEVWGFIAAFTEFFVPMFLIIGFLYRPATFLLAFNMIVATSVHLKNLDPWSKIAYPMMLVILFISMFIIGPGKFSLDEYLKYRKRRNET